ncbi:MAG: bifunctional oligoribonuclease/PAP phosphatase NrnA [Thermoanaerobaculaceae bacterium]|nr:bifunctional oligoribonuclease/PAP phosphatase NrnA [Thermoanaerobaculaceae bacterium]MDI9620914.1 bifunctional oligoribonuclease/PAP phosphatase NrnA [Acidobacteriota bacterium]HPW56800.1 bifunctional oligoribonuclease/PAP phosphatase NrnA [Thermoanaerobaculaceae bacterium]
MGEATCDAAAAAARLRQATRVLVVSHTSPDGDALGSALGAAEIVHALGSSAVVLSHDPYPSSLAFLPGIDRVLVQASMPKDWPDAYDLVLVLECPDLERTGFEAELRRLPILSIDHHVANTAYGQVDYLDPEAPAVGEMLLQIAEAAEVAVTPTMATCLYTALVTDTGDFRYSNATPRAFAAAARLVAAGARPHDIAEGLSGHTPARVVRLTAAILSTLELAADGRLAIVWCDGAMLQRTGAMAADTENIINIPRRIDGVEVAVLLKDFAPGAVRISMRSRDRVDVQAVVKRFGGGGHRAASGCTFSGSLAQAREAILAALLPLLEAP